MPSGWCLEMHNLCVCRLHSSCPEAPPQFPSSLMAETRLLIWNLQQELSHKLCWCTRHDENKSSWQEEWRGNSTHSKHHVSQVGLRHRAQSEVCFVMVSSSDTNRLVLLFLEHFQQMQSKGGSQIIYLMVCLKFLIMAQCVPTVTFHNLFQVTAMLFLSQFFINLFDKHPHRKLFQCNFLSLTGIFVVCSFLFHILKFLSHGLFHTYFAAMWSVLYTVECLLIFFVIYSNILEKLWGLLVWYKTLQFYFFRTEGNKLQVRVSVQSFPRGRARSDKMTQKVITVRTLWTWLQEDLEQLCE